MAAKTKNSLFRRAGLNAFTSYINFIVNAGLVFFINPFLVTYLGSHVFGVWKSIQQILGFASIADGRASQALKWVIANKKEEDNDRDKQEIVGSAIRIWLYFLPILIILVSTLVYFLPSLINGIEVKEFNIVRIAGLILGMNIILNPLLGIPDAVLVGINESHKSTTAQTFWVIVSNFLLVFAAFLGYGVIGLGVVVLLITLLKGLTVWYICKKNATWFGIRKPNKQQISKLFGFSFWIMSWSLVSRLLLSTEIILIGYLIGPEMVTNYTFSTYVFQLGVSIALMTGSATIPSLGNVLGAKNFNAASKIVNGTREIVLFVVVIAGGIMFVLNKPFVNLWMGGDFYLGDYVNLLITVVMIQLIIVRNESQIQDVSLKIKNKVLIGGLGAVLSLILGFVIFKLSGNLIDGIFYGIIIGRIIPVILFPIMVNKNLNIDQKFKPYLLSAFILLVCYFIGPYMPTPKNWFQFILVAFGFMFPLFLLAFFGVLSKDNRRILTDRITNFRKQ